MPATHHDLKPKSLILLCSTRILTKKSNLEICLTEGNGFTVEEEVSLSIFILVKFLCLRCLLDAPNKHTLNTYNSMFINYS